jgi:hypothetical protein
VKPDYAMRALPKLLFGGELFRDYDETKRALLVDALCLLLVLMGLAVDARGQSQEQAQSQAQQASSEAQAATQATQSQPQTQKNPPADLRKTSSTWMTKTRGSRSYRRSGLSSTRSWMICRKKGAGREFRRSGYAEGLKKKQSNGELGTLIGRGNQSEEL